MFIDVVGPLSPLVYTFEKSQSFSPIGRIACWRYSSKTITDRNLKLFPMSAMHLIDSSIYHTERIWVPHLAVNNPESNLINIESLPTSWLYIIETSDHLG